MNYIRLITNKLHPGQTPMTEAGQPLYTIAIKTSVAVSRFKNCYAWCYAHRENALVSFRGLG